MTDRFSPRPLLRGAWGSLRARAHVGTERRDWAAISVLAGLPLLLGVASWYWGWSIRATDPLIGGYSLLAGVLLAGVPQLAAWRQRLTDRSRAADGVAKRKLDEAVAHTLLGVLTSTALAAVSVVLGNISVPGADRPDVVIPAVARGFTTVIVVGSAYLVLTLVLVVNLVFDAYEDANSTPSERGHGRWTDHGAA